MTAIVRTLLLVDADGSRRAALAAQIRLHEALAAHEARDPREAAAFADAQPVDAVLLDPGDRDPADAVTALRRGGVDAVIVVLADGLTAAGAEAALEAGALDALDRRATRVSVLVARLRAHLRAHARRVDTPLAVGPVQFRPWPRLLVNVETGRRVHLTEKEVGLLRTLVRAGERPVGRHELLRAVWRAHPTVQTHTVETHIYRLRRKLAAVSPERVRVETAVGGYRLAADSAPALAATA